jgi:hypothetical protein
MDKCKHKNALEFFEWHRKLYGGFKDHKSKKETLIIDLRLSMIRQHEENIF